MWFLRRGIAATCGSRKAAPGVGGRVRGFLRLGFRRWAVGFQWMVALAAVCGARAELPEWMQHVVGASTVEAALYRAMEIPGAQAFYPRPPKEAVGELGGLIAQQPQSAELYSLRAMEEEQALDFGAAEADWKAFAGKTSDAVGGTLALADFYHRRLRPAEEAAELMVVAKAPGGAGGSPAEERSWQAFERLLALAADQALPDATVEATYVAWRARYPEQPVVAARYLHWLLGKKRYAEAGELIGQYRRAFPDDGVFPVKAAALLELSRGDGASVERALAVYDAAFEPLWPGELVESFYSLLGETHRQRRFLADARERLARNPDDLNALARIFYYYQQEGRLDAAEQEVEAFRLGKEARKAAWTAEDLYTLATMMEGAGAFPEAARYDYALYHAGPPATGGALPGGRTAQELGLTGMVRLLLKAPEQPIELGQGNLSMYRDIATLDRGPGYWNGILSLWFNSAEPAREFSEEENKAQPYFHRKKAAELLALLDRTAPGSVERPELHAELIGVYAEYGQTAAVIEAGQEFLTAFPAAAERLQVANAMADAYARTGDTKSEFSLYDRMLVELGAKAGATPLTAGVGIGGARGVVRFAGRGAAGRRFDPDAEAGGGPGVDGEADAAAKKAKNSRAFDIATTAGPVVRANPAAVEYAELLDRYLGRLTATKQLPQALAVLRRELDRNPGDPLLYERLADFLGQNNLSAQEEDVYRLAMGRFDDKSWYDRLARLYLRQRRREAFADLTRKVTDTFAGTELDRYFANVPAGGPAPGPAMYLELNLYAAKRFPHDGVFVRNLLQAYRSRGTEDAAAWEALLRQHWWESEDLRAEFFDSLSRTGRLDAELAQLQQIVAKPGNDLAAARELAEVDLWGSHFEQSAPLLGRLAEAYPADAVVGGEAVSVFRSLAYYDASQTARAVGAEKNLLAADPYDTEALATLGDLYAEQKAGGHEDLAAAGPFWRRIPGVHPGVSAGSQDGYLTAATIFWDYFEFGDALAEIRAARVKFGQPALYGYEAGAIAEGERDSAAAVAEYTAAALGGAGEARGRLLQLARRPAYKSLADQASAQAVTREPGSAAALGLRADVLLVLGRGAEIAPLLSAALARAASVEDAAEIAELAQARQLAPIYEAALEREAALAGDPVQKLELRYARARSMEGRADVAGAGQAIEGVYREDPRILGVVRATVDFDWRNGEREQGIAVLVEAAKAAQPELARQFRLEAANKANEAGNTAEARGLAMGLLGESPFDARYVAAAADSYARAGDDAGLKQFYLERLALVRGAASLTADEKKQNTVLLRRGLIPALTRLKDVAGAVDQYIAILSAYPEDAGTAQEAALYALQGGRQEQLLGFLRKTVGDSPRDSRFAILLGQAETTFEDLPAAVAAYSQAIAIRKDRVDLYAARAELEQRLQRFDEACADFERLYVLSYKDPAWMVEEAELRARQGRVADAVGALETAWVTGRPAAAKDQFMVAAQLEKWDLLTQAGEYAERGLKLAGDDLLLPSNAGTDATDAATYARIETRLGQPERALTTLLAARRAAETLPATAFLSAGELEDAKLTPADWRRMETGRRRNTAAGTFAAGMNEIAHGVGMYATPEQKLAYARVLEAHRAGGDLEADLAIAQAAGAGLKDREAAWRGEALLAATDSDERGEVGAYAQLQRSRMQFAELGTTLEAYAGTRRRAQRQGALLEAANAYRDGGDEAAEMRVLREILDENGAGSQTDERYFDLLLKRTPAELTRFAGEKNERLADVAVNLVISKGADAGAWAALEARGRSMEPVWRRAYTALLGLYLADKTERTDGAFREALDGRAIGERLGKVAARTERLVGDTWFYYGMRYGVYRTVAGQGDAEDYLAAELEGGPALEASYTGLARAYADAGKTDAALVEFGHALEIAPDDAAFHDQMAVLLWSAGRKDRALDEWRAALATLGRIEDRGAAPESFWSDFAAVVGNLGRRGLTGQLRPEIEGVVRPYIARNEEYRTSELLAAVYQASATPAEGLAWVLSLSEAANSPRGVLDVLNSLVNVAWLPVKDREPIYLRRIELARMQAQAANRPDDALTQGDVEGMQEALVLFYVEQREDAKARAALDAIAPARRGSAALVEARLVLAARAGGLPALLAGYRADPETAPDAEALHGAVRALENPDAPIEQSDRVQGGGYYYGGGSEPAAQAAASGAAVAPDWTNARAILEFLFERGQRSHGTVATDYLALAEARLHTGDAEGAIALLRRMTTSGTGAGGDAYANYELAAGLLERSGQPGAAVEFLAALAKNVPWDASFRLRLAEAELKSGSNADLARAGLRAVAASSDAAYEMRLRAAEDLAAGAAGNSQGAAGANPAGNGELGSVELNLIAAASRDTAAARQPYFAAARIAAASSAQGAAARAELLLEALAIAPQDAASEPARLGIFSAEFEAGNNALAAAAIEPELQRLLHEPGLLTAVAERTGATALDRERLADQVATVYERLGRDAEAALYLGEAVSWETDAGRRAALEARRARIIEAQAVEAENRARRPIVGKALDQSNLVRPRVSSVELAQRRVLP